MIDPILYSSNQQESGKKKNMTVVIFIVIVIAIIGGVLFLKQPKKTEPNKTDLVENKEPSPTEKPQIDKKSVKIQVLNGTGTPGQAGIAVEVLKKAGYNPDNIKTANAKDFNNIVTTITAKDGFDDVASYIKDVLITTFNEIKIDSTLLDNDSEFDIVVTTGGKIFELTPTQSPAPSPTITTPTSTSTPTTTPTPTSTPISSPTPTP
jgi:hypothetical protein